jgi:hypothetical protein
MSPLSSSYQQKFAVNLNTMNLAHRLRSGWTALKFVRVGLGGLILYSSIESGQVTGIVLGTLFTAISLFTDGVCCAGGACYTPDKKNNSSTSSTVEYEELGTK